MESSLCSEGSELKGLAPWTEEKCSISVCRTDNADYAAGAYAGLQLGFGIKLISKQELIHKQQVLVSIFIGGAVNFIIP